MTDSGLPLPFPCDASDRGSCSSTPLLGMWSAAWLLTSVLSVGQFLGEALLSERLESECARPSSAESGAAPSAPPFAPPHAGRARIATMAHAIQILRGIPGILH